MTSMQPHPHVCTQIEIRYSEKCVFLLERRWHSFFIDEPWFESVLTGMQIRTKGISKPFALPIGGEREPLPARVGSLPRRVPRQFRPTTQPLRDIRARDGVSKNKKRISRRGYHSQETKDVTKNDRAIGEGWLKSSVVACGSCCECVDGRARASWPCCCLLSGCRSHPP